MIKDLCFEILQKCPNNCIFCSSGSDWQKENVIDFGTIKRTIDFFVAKGGIGEISLSGGEPLLHPDIVKIVEYCHNNNMFVTLYTSGIIKHDIREKSDNPYFQSILEQHNVGLFSEVSLEKFSQLKQAGLDKVVFDMQAAEASVYDRLMGTKNNFSNLLKSMQNAVKFDWETSVHFVPNKLNASSFKDVFELAEGIGIDEVRVLKFVSQGRGRENRDVLQLSPEETYEFLDQCSQIESDTTRLKVGIPLQEHNTHKCTAGFDKLDIRYDGQILPCPAFKDADIAILEQNGFDDVNIYTNLEDFKFIEGASRETPLCQQLNEDMEQQE